MCQLIVMCIQFPNVQFFGGLVLGVVLFMPLLFLNAIVRVCPRLHSIGTQLLVFK